MAFELEWFFNCSTESFIRGASDASSINPPSLVAGDTPTLLVTFFKNGTATSTVEKITSATSARVSIGPLGAAATSAVGTGPDSLGRYTFVLPMGVAGVTSLIGSSAFVITPVEFKIGSPFQSYQAQVKVKGYLDAGATTPTPAPDVNVGLAQARGLFTLRDGSTDANPWQEIRRSSGPLGTLFLVTLDDSGAEVKEPLI